MKKTTDISFIPKKKFEPTFYRQKGASGIVIYSGVLLFVSSLFLGGAYFYKDFQAKQVNKLRISIERAQIVSDESLTNELRRVSGKIETAKTLLSRHKTLIPIFDFLEESTLKSVSFSNFNYSNSDKPEISMNGEAKSYSSLALQIDEFNNNAAAINVLLNDLSLGEEGSVKFKIAIEIDPAIIVYKPGVKQ